MRSVRVMVSVAIVLVGLAATGRVTAQNPPAQPPAAAAAGSVEKRFYKPEDRQRSLRASTLIERCKIANEPMHSGA